MLRTRGSIQSNFSRDRPKEHGLLILLMTVKWSCSFARQVHARCPSAAADHFQSRLDTASNTPLVWLCLRLCILLIGQVAAAYLLSPTEISSSSAVFSIPITARKPYLRQDHTFEAETSVHLSFCSIDGENSLCQYCSGLSVLELATYPGVVRYSTPANHRQDRRKEIAAYAERYELLWQHTQRASGRPARKCSLAWISYQPTLKALPMIIKFIGSEGCGFAV